MNSGVGIRSENGGGKGGWATDEKEDKGLQDLDTRRVAEVGLHQRQLQPFLVLVEQVRLVDVEVCSDGLRLQAVDGRVEDGEGEGAECLEAGGRLLADRHLRTWRPFYLSSGEEKALVWWSTNEWKRASREGL